MDTRTGSLFSSPPNQSCNCNITSSPILTTSKCFVFLLCAGNFVLHALILIALHRQAGHHANIRLMIGNFSLAAIAWSCFHFYRCVFYFAVRGNDDRMRTTQLDCILQELLPSSAIRTASFTVVGTALERFWSIRFHATYEQTSHWFGVVFSLVAWLQGFSWSVASIVISTRNMTTAGEKIDYCANILAANYVLIGATVAFLLACTVLSCGGFLRVYRMCLNALADFKASKLDLSLSSRMQLKHSVEITLSMAPCVISHALIRLSIQIYILILTLAPFCIALPFPIKVDMVSIYEVCTGLFFLLDAALFIVYSRHIQQKIIEALRLDKVPALEPWVAKLRMQWKNCEFEKLEYQWQSSTAHIDYLLSMWNRTSFVSGGNNNGAGSNSPATKRFKNAVAASSGHPNKKTKISPGI